MSEDDNTRTVAWGIRTWMPDGFPDVELRDERSNALTSACVNASRSQQPVELVWRTVDAGPWSEEGTGDEWGVRFTWSDRPCSEVEASRSTSRVDAERSMRLYQGTATTTLVTRRIIHGEWTIELTAQPGNRPPTVHLNRPTMPQWLTLEHWRRIIGGASRA